MAPGARRARSANNPIVGDVDIKSAVSAPPTAQDKVNGQSYRATLAQHTRGSFGIVTRSSLVYVWVAGFHLVKVLEILHDNNLKVEKEGSTDEGPGGCLGRHRVAGAA